MKTDRLAKYYRSLAPDERLSLIIAACDREDFEERDRLVKSAPRQVVSVPHHHFLAMSLDELAQRYVSRQLHLLVQYLRWTNNDFKTAKSNRTRKRSAGKRDACSAILKRQISLKTALGLADDVGPENHAESLSNAAKMAAYMFCVNAGVWRQLCDELGINAKVTLDGVLGADEVDRMVPLMHHAAFDAEQASVYVKQVGDGTDEAVSVEEMTTAMRDSLNSTRRTTQDSINAPVFQFGNRQHLRP